MDNHAVIGHCLQYLKVGLSKFVAKHFPGENTTDVANCLKLIAFRWNELDAVDVGSSSEVEGILESLYEQFGPAG